MKARLALVLPLILAACGPSSSTSGARPPMRGRGVRVPEPSPQLLDRAANEFRSTRDDFLAWYYESHPVRASQLGVHTYDARLPALDAQGVQRRIDDLLDWEAELQKVPFQLMRDEDHYDYAVLEYGIRDELLRLEEIRGWVTDPRLYTSTIAAGLASVAEREYAPLPDRVAALRARLEEAPQLLEAARANVQNPPRLWTELAIGDARGLMAYLDTDLPALLEAQNGGPLPANGVDVVRQRLLDALRDHVAWLETELLPASHGNYRLGRYLFLRKLLYEEHLDVSVEELDRLNEETIREYEKMVERVAAEIDSTRTARAIMDSIARLHPTPETLVPTARAMMDSARAWVLAHDVVTVPEGPAPEVEESLPYDRGAFAYLDPAGPFDTTGLAAYYRLTNVDPSWTEAQKDAYLTYFSYPGLLGVTLHETYPGHFVQQAFERKLESAVRKVFAPRSLTEGWAHYAEQMALDEGFTGNDAGARLGQLRRALQRQARWYAGLHLHALGEPMDSVVHRFMDIAYFDELPARREVVRATYDPTYLYYALGRMQIIELRKDYQAYLEKQDQTFSLKEFHDRLLSLGLPLPLAREAMIPRQATASAARPGRR